MPTINQLVRKSREKVEYKSNSPDSEAVPSAPRRLHRCSYHDSQKAELRTP